MDTQNIHDDYLDNIIYRAPNAWRPLHKFHTTRSTTRREGKEAVYDAVTSMVLEHAPENRPLKFMSLPGKYWQFETQLERAYREAYNQPVLFTGFEYKEEVMLQGAVYTPRSYSASDNPKPAAFKEIVDIKTVYFSTNRARWVCMDVNTALTLDPSFWHYLRRKDRVDNYNAWMHKFTMWDSVWIDYFGPACAPMGDALCNLHYHCNPELENIPVAVTIMFRREQVHRNEGMRAMFVDKGEGKRKWLEYHLAGGSKVKGITFETLDFIRYNDTSPMCTILGLIRRT
jgi:hypothetical protein